jgi:GAF domain-containing protein
MRDIARFHQEAIRALSDAGATASAAAGPEEALWAITNTLPGLLGDRESHLQPGNLKAGEKQQFACCCFVVTPDRKYNCLIAPVNFGPTQRHMKIDIELGHPGHVVRTQQPMLLANTDTHKSFVKILATFRAGSAVFAPLMWGPTALGVIICASQARNTFNAADLAVHVAFSHLAAAQWMAHAGPAYLNQLAG